MLTFFFVGGLTAFQWCANAYMAGAHDFWSTVEQLVAFRSAAAPSKEAAVSLLSTEDSNYLVPGGDFTPEWPKKAAAANQQVNRRLRKDEAAKKLAKDKEEKEARSKQPEEKLGSAGWGQGPAGGRAGGRVMGPGLRAQGGD